MIKKISGLEEVGNSLKELWISYKLYRKIRWVTAMLKIDDSLHKQ